MKRTRITFEISQTTIIRRRGKIVRIECGECGSEAVMVTLEEAVALTGMAAQEICKLIGEGQVHFSESPGGVLMICHPSLNENSEAIADES